MVIAKDPDTGVRNASIMRCMITGRDRMTCLMDIGRHLRDYYERAEARGEPLEITINNGVDPAVHFASVVPAVAAPIELDELGIAEDTIVMYSTDNGAEVFTWPDGGTTMFAGEKATQWEGGFRVPCAIRWPGVIKPGTVINDIFHHMDWIPTIPVMRL